MKIGPNYFPTTLTAGSVLLITPPATFPLYTDPLLPNPKGPFPSVAAGTVIYNTNVVTNTCISLPVDARGMYDKTFMLSATSTSYLSATTLTVIMEYSNDPQCIVSPTQVQWYPAATLTANQLSGTHSGIVRAFRARVSAVSNSDFFNLTWMGDDRG